MFMLFFPDFSVNLAEGAGGVGFVGIDMHRGGEIAAHAHDHVVKINGRAVSRRTVTIPLVGQTEGGGFVRRQMNVALGGDDALAQA